MSTISLYFLVKTGLYYQRLLGFHWVLNLLLAIVAFWPLPHPRWQRARKLLVWPLAAALLYHDAFLPTPQRLWSQLGALGGFSSAYLQELLGRLIRLDVVALLALLLLSYSVLARRVRFATLALLGILSVPLAASLGSPTAPAAGVATPGPGRNAATPLASAADADLQSFYRSEQQRRLTFAHPLTGPDFDLIVLHVCSLSWDDLDLVNQRNAPFLKRFDVLFSHFNSAASYSGPATIRIFRGNCGQSPHRQLYQRTDPDCYTFPALEKAGFKTMGLLNHNGIFDGFAKIVEHEAGLSGRMQSNRNGMVQMQAFDGSPVYDDFALLSQWWTQRQKQGGSPVALYYNTISLHDGNRLPGARARSSSVDTYKPRLQKLLGDFDRFVTQLEASGKPVVLLLVPEHGASLRGDTLQIAGMREIPDPKITLVPAALKLIGMGAAARAGGPVVLSQDISYFGLYSLLAQLMNDNPFAPGGQALAARLEQIETTPYVAENDDVVIVGQRAGGYLTKSNEGSWLPLGKP